MGSFCGVVWDGLMCWPSTPAGVTVSLQCPSYIHGFRSGGFAQRECTESGQWYVSPATKRTWTNFSDCTIGPPEDMRVSSELANQVANIKIIYTVGYALTSLTLIVAITTMLSFRKLHCPRNTIHINLFLSFILRAVISFLRNVLFVDGLGLKKDVVAFTSHKSSDALSEDSSHWECRALMVVMNYTVLTNHLWIFIEGLYLCNMIFRDVFSENNPVTNYIIFGWLAALPSVLCWTCVRYFFENYLCWNVRFTASYFWIIRLPMVVIVVINFFFFVNILRVLFTKLQRTKTPKARKRKLRKLARSTLVLIPMLGIPNMFFLGMPDNAPELAETVKLYFEMIFNSYNGVIVAFLFCFLNGEVQSEMKRKWRHCRSRRRNEVDLKMSRRSLVNSTASASFVSCQHLASIKKPQNSQRLHKNCRPATSPPLVSI